MRVVILAVSILCLMACGDTGIQGPDAAPKDTTQSVDTDAPPQPDTSVADTGDTQRGETSQTCEAGEGCFGEPCQEGGDCLSDICTLHMGQKVCSKTCDSTCPDGWSCTLISGAGDGQYVCVSNMSHLCLPCTSNDGCTAETPQACVRYPDGMSFCGGACSADNPCPKDYSCQNVETVSGTLSYQCMPDAGICPCTDMAITSGLASPCLEANDIGSCEGLRKCTAAGLEACDAATPEVELCDGIDNDCNGLVDEGTCDDGNACTEDSCNGEAGCTHTPLAEGECLDGDACTIGDHCEAGVCVGKSIDCDDGNPCTADSCDGLGGCKNEALVAVCDDGDPCTLGDICTEGICTGSATLTCDDGNPCTDESCGQSGCVSTPNALPCDDGNACTENDGCLEGGCQGSNVVCDDGELCTTDACDPVNGCTTTPNTQPCDDGDVCTLQDACDKGGCVAGAAPLTCDDGNPCTDDGCDGVLGCVFTANDNACNDNNACTVSDTCVAGNCGGSGSLACDDGNACTVDSCLGDGGCQYAFVVGGCDDGDPCTLGDTCSEGVCNAGSPLSCNDGNPCTDEACTDGDCVFTANEAPCDDGNACTSASVCQDKACLGTESLECNDGESCTDDGCDPLAGCTVVPNQAVCTDGDPCTLGDHCKEGSCTAGADTLTCNDDNPCTDDACESNVGCLFTPNAESCNDGDNCTVGDVCSDGVCLSGGDSLPCDDGLFCNGSETCLPQGGCIPGTPPVLSDDIGCTQDSCDEATKTILHQPNHATCSDGNACNGEETCDVAAKGCIAGIPVVIDDGFPCTNDQCDPLTGAVTHTPDNDQCDTEALCGVAICTSDAGCQEEIPESCCGNGILEPGEACDDGDKIDNDSCKNDCTLVPIGFKEFLAPGNHTFVVPPGVFEIKALAIGGGGSGNLSGGGSGGGGGGGAKSLVSVTPGQQIQLVVGRGGGNTGTFEVHLNGGTSSIGAPVNINATGGSKTGTGGIGTGGSLHNSEGGTSGSVNVAKPNAKKLDGVPEESGDAGGAGSGLQGFTHPVVGKGIGYGGGGGGQNCNGYGGSCDGGMGGENGFYGGAAGEDGQGPSGGKTGNAQDNQWFWDNCSPHSYYNGGGGGSFGAGGGNDGSGQGDKACAVGLYLGGDGGHGYVRFEWGILCDGCCGNSKVDPGEQCDDGNLTPGDGCDDTCQKDGPPCPEGLMWEGYCVIKAPKFVNCATRCAQAGLTCKDPTIKWFGLAENHTNNDPPCKTLCPGVQIFLGGADCSQAPYCAAWGCAYCAGGITTTCQSAHDDQKLCPCE